MFTYRLHFEDGSDAGEATYAVMIGAGRGDPRRHQPPLLRPRRRPVRRGGVAVRGAAKGRGGVVGARPSQQLCAIPAGFYA